MAIKTVVKMGDTQLATPSIPITDIFDDSVASIVKDMQDTMIAEDGVGIAAPQIGYNVRIIIFGFEDSSRYPDEYDIPYTVLINPSFEPISDEMEDGWEGCLSVPGMRGLVPRYTAIKYSGYNLDGELISREVDGFHARVVQHEYDHIEGILYPIRIKDLRFFGFEDSLDLA
ncbi:MAG: peptide deformylase [Legionellaceae bacterium]|nr:peptide deformylase [Legionellaceae bacterium]